MNTLIDHNKKKEYLVQVTVIEGRHLSDKDDGSSNPYVKITVGQHRPQATDYISRNINPTWNQSFTFSGLEFNDQELQTGELMFEVFSRNRFKSNDLIGKYAINLSTLYKNANHEYYNVWLCLTNPDEEGNESDDAQGYLLVNCFIISEGDRPPVHDINDRLNADMEEDDEDLNVDQMTFEELRAFQEKKQGIQILGKPSVARKAFQLSCYVFKADGLCDFPGVFGMVKPNFFVSCRAMGLVQKTKCLSDNSAPLINQKMLFPTYFPFLNDKIIMRCWNYQKSGADKFIANVPEFSVPNDYFNISKLMSISGRMPAKWINLYGIPPMERNDQISGGKRKHPRSGTAYLGRVLISFSLLANPKPTVQTLPCNPFHEPDTLTYRLFADVYEIKFLKDYDIVVWCDVTIGTYSTGNSKKKKPNKKSSIEWKIDEEKNEVCLPTIVQNFPKDISSVPDIFVNLYSGGSKDERIGYYRVKAEQVLGWEPLPRWLHFNSLDTTKDSPGSILINLQFMIDNEQIKRKVKQRGIDSAFTLYAHIVSGFELDSKDADNTEIETIVEVDIKDKIKATKERKGRFPFWNELLEIDVDLDAKLDFAPDISITLKKKTPKTFFSDEKLEIVGHFTVPIWCCKKKKTLPHYFNCIRNNDTVGRILAMFYIHPKNKKKNQQQVFPIYESLNNTQSAKVSISVLGVRNLDFESKLEDAHFEVNISQDTEDIQTQNKIHNEKEELAKFNSGEKENILNFIQLYEFNNIKIYGDSTFQIYPMVKINFHKLGFFGDEERFLIFNLAEYSNTISEKTKKKFRKMFECNLGNSRVDQEQFILTEIGEEIEENKEDKGLGDDDEEDEIAGPTSEEALLKLKQLQEEDEEFDECLDKKMVAKMTTYKNCEISEDITLECLPSDKTKERETKKDLRRIIFMEMKELKKKDFLSTNETEKLINLNQKYRELKKPLMNEDIFYNFDDLADEYDYGREIYKEDVYETHPDLKIPFETKKLCILPKGVFADKCEKMEGYYKLGKETNCFLKYKVEIQLNNISEEEEKERLKKEAKITKIEKNKKKKESLMNPDDEALKIELKSFNVFNQYFINRLRNCYFNKVQRRELKKDQICFPMHNVKIRIYILRALNLTAQDSYASVSNAMSGFVAYSRANSYIEIMVGEKYKDADQKQLKYIDDSLNFIPETLNPSFFKTFEMDGDLPQDWKLTINIRSKKEGGLGSDSLIGSTVIDLEDRYLGDFKNNLTLSYKAYEDLLNKQLETDDEDLVTKKLSLISGKLDDLKTKEVPVEFRPIYHPDRKTAQGVLEMFVEVMSNQTAKLVKPAKIEKPAPEDFEIRLVIWEMRNLPATEKKPLSVFITCAYKPEGYLSEEVKKETDTHLNTTDGWAVYNWRMKFPLRVPCSFPRLYFNVLDFQFGSDGEVVGECYISLKRLFKRLLQEGKLNVDKKWIPLTHPKDPGDSKGEMCISLNIIQKFEAEQDPVGEERNEPNKNPYLETPTAGRKIKDFLKGINLAFKFNFNLFGMFKILGVLTFVLTIVIILFVSPGILVK